MTDSYSKHNGWQNWEFFPTTFVIHYILFHLDITTRMPFALIHIKGDHSKGLIHDNICFHAEFSQTKWFQGIKLSSIQGQTLQALMLLNMI